MSYSRFAVDSDLYVFFNSNGYYECCACVLNRPNGKLDPWVESAGEMLVHVQEHSAAGHKVPGYLVERLKEDEAELAATSTPPGGPGGR